MLNSVQHLTKSRPYEILKQVQDDKTRLFTRPSHLTKGGCIRLHTSNLIKIILQGRYFLVKIYFLLEFPEFLGTSTPVTGS
jgi:hypothetical protein